MSSAPVALRTLAFGDLEGTVWGAGWFAGPAGRALTMLGGDAQGAVLVEGRPPADGDVAGEWHLQGAGELVAAPAAEAVGVQTPKDQVEGYDQLCRVTGRLALDGEEREVDCLGVRTWFPGPIELERYESIRAVSTWFEPDEAMALTAFRARKAKAHDGDLVAAAVIGPENSTAVEDPRLSTTYGTEGWPVRAGLELWLPTPEDAEQQFPRRASGEALGERAQAESDGLEVRAGPFRWHSRGRDGAGMYILARRR
ncbi:MAG TPA: hypothetical protein VMF57_04055 [Solirubrobacteraceae bacterium]|nr:hypothetical protein [Solirubrobacteraceae bacterium]